MNVKHSILINSIFWKRILKKYNWGKLGLELLVVFLGVSSGFLLNSWREKNQQEELKQKYVIGFIQDVDDNIEELMLFNDRDSLWMISAKENLVDLKEHTLIKDSAEAMMIKILMINKIQPHGGTYEDVTNSGNLNIFDDYLLKSQIVDYQISISGVGFVDDYFHKYFNNFVMPFIFDNFNVLTGKFIDYQNIKSTEFSNIFAGYFSMIQQRNVAYKNLLKESIELRETLMRAKRKD